MAPRKIRSAKDQPILDGEVESFVPERSEVSAPDPSDAEEAGKLAVAHATLSLEPKGEPPLFGSRAFFERAADELAASTIHGLELAGACYARPSQARPGAPERVLLVGLRRCASGKPGRVAIDPEWGSILWHTHPGLKGSLAAFSNEDVEAARRAGRPLLVIGFGGLSPDVITTLTLPLGLKGLLISGGVKAILALEKYGHLRARLLRLGVAARVCYPSGRIQPVVRQRGTPLRYALDDMSFAIDRAVGAIERSGQAAIRRVVERAVGRRG